jgi:hypothetical protein
MKLQFLTQDQQQGSVKMSESDCVEVETSKKQGMYVCQRLCALGKGWQEAAHAFYLSLKD